MGKQALINFGKNVFKDLKDKLIQQGKETLKSTADEILQQGKETVINTAKDKFSTLTSEWKVGKKEKSATKAENETSSKTAEFKSETPGRKEPQVDDIDSHNAKAEEDPKETPYEVITPLDEDDLRYRDGEQFEKRLNNRLVNLTENFVANNPAAAAMVLKELVTTAGEVSKFTEVQKTKRKEIDANRQIYVEKIQAQKEVMLAYLDKSFDERKDNFTKLFAVVDHAMASNNMQQLSMSLESINNLAASSPFKALVDIESTNQALNNKAHIWDI